MNIFNLLSKALTGYKSKSKLVKGQKVTYRYVGKPVLFDAFTMLMDFNSHYEVAKIITPNLSFQTEIGNLPFWDLKDQNPAVVFSALLNNERFQVNRYVHHLDHKPCSKYEFYLGDQKLANFARVYDYGATIKKFLIKQKNHIPDYETLQNQPFTVDLENDRKFLAENFGHSQFWKIDQWNKLSELIEYLIHK
ncbi:hypothetical protein [Algoriphagus hitonicola]|uniref:Uncharacterized protein n=1 Tax=Algoriphagus hitonicola TaxID=435880 RepID=A0A1I2XRQ0_9BACT|nr:hypothetical protein [Algoriphagus hitonicola]SFH15759.1 hypothetical protein SAMN04487988_1221 [Algoriphagus hitonicola]